MRFTLALDNPKDFYNEAHRMIHFLDFAGKEDKVNDKGDVDMGADREDHFE